MTLWKKLMCLVIFVAVIFNLIGCSRLMSSSGEVSEDTLSIWCRESSSGIVSKIIEKFNSENHGFELKLTTFPDANFSDQFAVALANHSAPDIVSMDDVLVPYFSSIGAFDEITSKFRSLSLNDQFNEEMLHQGTYHGKQFAIPFSADVSALIYNKKHFREAGLDPNHPPKTWSEFVKQAKVLTNEDHYGYVYAGGDAGTQVFTFLPLIWSNGGRVLNKEGTKSVINSQETIKALDFYSDLTLKNNVTPKGVATYTATQSTDAFTSGKASMLLSGSFTIANFNANFPSLDYGVTLIPKPKGKNHSSFAGGDLLAIPKQSRHHKEAWQFIKYALSKKAQVDVIAKSGSIPVREEFHDNKYFDKEPKYKVFAKALEVAGAPYSTNYNEIFFQPVLSAQQNALQGKLSPEEAFNQADEQIKKILQQFN